MIITFERTYLENSTISKIITPNNIYYGCELPWKDNQQNISCIPEGIYTAKLFNSNVVNRTSKGEFKQGWVLQDVLGRSSIVIHIGNSTKDSQGCPLIGSEYHVFNNGADNGGVVGVSGSSVAFKRFMLETKDTSELIVHFKTKVIYDGIPYRI